MVACDHLKGLLRLDDSGTYIKKKLKKVAVFAFAAVGRPGVQGVG